MDCSYLKELNIIITIVLFVISQGHTIDYTVSSDTHSCPKGTANNCHQLSFYARHTSKYFVSNATFNFLSGIHSLNSPIPVVIGNIESITLTGKGTIPTILCNKETYGFEFENISTSVTIVSLSFDGCGESMYDGSITFKNIASLMMKNVSVKNTIGIGIVIENVLTVHVMNSQFSDNGIGVHNCSLETYRWWYGVDITASNMSKVSYSFINTSFHGNSHMNQLGGGLHISATHIDSTSVNISGCEFREINGCLSTGVNITIDGFSTRVDIEISYSTLSENIRNDIKNYETNLELDGGALKVKTIQTPLSASQPAQSPALLNIHVFNCDFLRNKANYCGGIGILTETINAQSNVIIHDNTLIGNSGKIRGGGMCINPVSSDNSNGNFAIAIYNCTFVSNVASDGAALLIWPSWSGNATFFISVSQSYFVSNNTTIVNNSYHQGIVTIRWTCDFTTRSRMSVVIENCFFAQNINGPCLYLTTDSTYVYQKSNYKLELQVKGCIFDGNTRLNPNFINSSSIFAEMGNGDISMEIDDCLVSNGTGNAIFITDEYSLWKSNFAFRCSLKNVTLVSTKIDNKVYDTVLHMKCSSRLTKVNIADINIRDNPATAITILNCAVNFSGHNEIVNNKVPLNGGGMLIHGSGYILTTPGATLLFKQNQATFGGAMYSYNELSDSTSACTFSNANVTFIDNSARKAGNDVYGGIFTNCVAIVNGGIAYVPDTNDRCSRIPENMRHGISSDPYSCNATNNDSLTPSTDVIVYPGQVFKLLLTTTGYCYHFSPGFIDITSSEGLFVETDVEFQHVVVACQELSFKPSLSSPNISNGSMIVGLSHLTIPSIVKLKVNIKLLPCPLGMHVGDSKICQCDNTILGSVDSIQCNISWIPNPFMKPTGENSWLTYDNQRNCSIIAKLCPFDYCSTKHNTFFNLDNNTDIQCVNNRSGTLCGQCQPGLSLMLGSNACSQCTNTYLLLIPVFIVAGIVLVVLIIVLNLTVSVGSINGLLFYANVVKLNEAVLFPIGGIPVISQFISWINLDFGIEVCLFNGLDGYLKTWLQYAFPLYVWLLTGAIIVLSKYSMQFSRHLRSNIISVLATLVLMAFTKILRNITAAFMATTLHCGDSSQIVWSIDGNIEYLSIKHSLLFGISALALIFVVVYTVVILLSQCIQRGSSKVCHGVFGNIYYRLYPFIDAYTGPFTERHRYWTGLLLLIRIFIAVTFTYTSGSVSYINDYFVIIIEVTLIFSIFHSGFHRLYSNYYYEKFFHINLCVLCCVNSLLSQSLYKQYTFIATIVSVSLSMIMLTVIILQQIYLQYLKPIINKNKTKIEEQPLLDNAAESGDPNHSPSEVIRRRDSIIFDLDLDNDN